MCQANFGGDVRDGSSAAPRRERARLFLTHRAQGLCASRGSRQQVGDVEDPLGDFDQFQAPIHGALAQSPIRLVLAE